MLFRKNELTEEQWEILSELVSEREMSFAVFENGNAWELTGSDLYVLSDELGECGEWELSRKVDKEYWEQYCLDCNDFDETESDLPDF